MQHSKAPQLSSLKSKYWFRQPANLFLIGVACLIICLYLINPLIELLAG